MRELPPLRHSVEVETPGGRFYRWADDEPNPSNVPSGLRHSSTMPGGFESFDATLPRRTSIDYADLQRLSTVRVRDASGSIVSETRLERTPRVSGDKMAVSPSAVGWQANLEDDKSASMIYIDHDLGRWTGPSSTYRLALIAAGFNPIDPVVQPNSTTGEPTLENGFDDNPWTTAGMPAAEAFYDAGPGNNVGRIRLAWSKGANVDATNVNWHWDVLLATGDDTLAGADTTGELRASGPSIADLSATADRRFAVIRTYFDALNTGVTGKHFAVYWTLIRVLGDHGLSLRNFGGFYASDIVGHAVGQWAPELRYVPGETVVASSFVIPQLAFYDPTTAGEIIRQATRFGLQDWAVWDDKTFWWHPRGMFGRSWRARISPAQLEETGPQIDRLWNSVLVQYQDVDGSTRTVGPVGSGADTEDASLEDTDPENPANQLGITRRDLLTMGVGFAASATEVGRRFLEEQKLLDTSGRAQFVGHVEDDRGVLHPYSHVRAGDYVTFVDAADSSARRIVRAEHDHGSRTCTVDLDAPPEGLAALLERLGVVLTPLGL